MIVSEAELVASITRDRAAGKRIGFVRASFDLLRVDLVRAIQAVAAKSDRLVVTVIERDGTPVVSATDRAEIVDSLRGVSYVIVSPADQVERLTGLLTPFVT